MGILELVFQILWLSLLGPCMLRDGIRAWWRFDDAHSRRSLLGAKDNVRLDGYCVDSVSTLRFSIYETIEADRVIGIQS